MRAILVSTTRFVLKTPMEALRTHWFLYVYEGAELAWFMVAACVCTVVLFGAASPVVRDVPSAALRRAVMGVAMGVTAVMIIHSGMGKRSGAHFNPAITLTYLWLGKIGIWDALGYVVGQFVGGVAGVGVSALAMRRLLAQPSVEYAVTVPGIGGTAGAFAAELFMAVLLMGVVLWTTNRPRLARYTSYVVGVLIANYVFWFAPVSGFSINPARTVGSAVFAGVWTAEWVYFVLRCWGCLGQRRCTCTGLGLRACCARSCIRRRVCFARLRADRRNMRWRWVGISRWSWGRGLGGFR